MRLELIPSVVGAFVLAGVLHCAAPQSPPSAKLAPATEGATMSRPPRLLLEVLPFTPAPRPPPPPPGKLPPPLSFEENADPNQVRELRLTLINESEQPVELPEPLDVTLKFTDADGHEVKVADVRALEYPAPRPPRGPGKPLKPGEQRVLARQPILKTPKGYRYDIGHAMADLPAGSYRVKTGTVYVTALDRAQWVNGTAWFLGRTGGTPAEKARTDAERYAAHYEGYWSQVGQLWCGELVSNEVAFTLEPHSP